jgi:hypothetical protein
MGNPIVERLAWTQTAPAPGGLYFAECGPYRFEISRTADAGYLLQMRQIRPEDWPLLFGKWMVTPGGSQGQSRTLGQPARSGYRRGQP